MAKRSIGAWVVTILVGWLGVASPLAAAPQLPPAPPSPYAGQELRELKAVSPEDVRALEAGEGMGLAKAAELNRYPGPRHVLDLAGPLALTAAQRAATERLLAEMHAESVRLGQEILGLERNLDAGFRTEALNEAELARLTDALGRLQGQLRAAHLRAHLRQRALLTPAQVERYQQLRGYESAAGPAHEGAEPQGRMHHPMR